jgi:hypothetical protein
MSTVIGSVEGRRGWLPPFSRWTLGWIISVLRDALCLISLSWFYLLPAEDAFVFYTSWEDVG